MSIQRTRNVLTGRVITVNIETVQLPNDDQLRVCLIRQYRHAVGGYIWELPAGKLEPAEPPLVTAQRELVEEAGTEAAHWHSLGSVISSPGVFTETVHLFLARGLRSAKMAHEAAEVIEIHWVDLAAACQRAEAGDINDGKTALGLLRARAALLTLEQGAGSGAV
jgi:ADP-ribose pyrophosphatase